MNTLILFPLDVASFSRRNTTREREWVRIVYDRRGQCGVGKSNKDTGDVHVLKAVHNFVYIMYEHKCIIMYLDMVLSKWLSHTM